MRSHVWSLSAAALALLLQGSAAAYPQAFANVSNALVDYTKADTAPRKTCDALAKFKAKDIAEIHATVFPAANNIPAHCRITGGATSDSSISSSICSSP